MSLRGVWRLCNLPCVYALFWLISIASHVFKSPSICFQGTKYEINREDVVYLHSVVYLHCRRFYNDMGLVPKFRKGKRCRRKLEKKNMRLKPEMTNYLCFWTWWILRLLRYSLTFGFHWTHPSVRSPWYQWHNCSSNMTRIQALFWLWLYIKSTRFAYMHFHFRFQVCFLWRSAISHCNYQYVHFRKQHRFNFWCCNKCTYTLCIKIRTESYWLQKFWGKKNGKINDFCLSLCNSYNYRNFTLLQTVTEH